MNTNLNTEHEHEHKHEHEPKFQENHVFFRKLVTFLPKITQCRRTMLISVNSAKKTHVFRKGASFCELCENDARFP